MNNQFKAWLRETRDVAVIEYELTEIVIKEKNHSKDAVAAMKKRIVELNTAAEKVKTDAAAAEKKIADEKAAIEATAAANKIESDKVAVEREAAKNEPKKVEARSGKYTVLNKKARCFMICGISFIPTVSKEVSADLLKQLENTADFNELVRIGDFQVKKLG